MGKFPTKRPKNPVDAQEWKLLLQLSELGVRAKSVWDLVNGPNDYDLAVPLLLRSLDAMPRKPEFARLREGIVRALTVPALKKCPQAGDLLMRVYGESSPLDKWTVAMSFARVARREHAPFILGAVTDPRNGKGREPLLPLLKKFLPEKAERILLQLLRDDTVGPLWPMRELGYCGSARAVPHLEPFLNAKHARWRKKAAWAIHRIQRRARRK